MKRLALAMKFRPRSLNLQWLIVNLLLIDRFASGLPGWALGAIYMLFAIVFLISMVDFFTAEDVDLTGRVIRRETLTPTLPSPSMQRTTPLQ